MRMYERSLVIDMIETKLLQEYPEYCPQGQYNNTFVKYLYKYLENNTYSGEHSKLYIELLKLKDIDKTITIKENVDRQTYTVTSKNVLSSDVITEINNILKKYYNYRFTIKSKNRIQFEVLFSWLPPNVGSWLNLLNDECLIDYYIDNITLRPNIYTEYAGKPNSGYLCYKIDSVKEYDTIAFLIDSAFKIPEKIKVASLLEELKGTEGATLNRIAEINAENFLYEIGPYSQNYLSSKKASLIIQIPYDYVISEAFYVFNVSRSVLINNKNNPSKPNDIINFLVLFSDENYDSKFIYNYLNEEVLLSIISSNKTDILDKLLYQYIFGDFIWKTSDSKLIAYLQNLVSAIFPTAKLTPDGIWSTTLSSYIERFKSAYNDLSIFDDDVVDKATEELMINEYKRLFNNQDPNTLFNEW